MGFFTFVFAVIGVVTVGFFTLVGIATVLNGDFKRVY